MIALRFFLLGLHIYVSDREYPEILKRGVPFSGSPQAINAIS